MELLAHTRTPIWTGGATRDSGMPKESGIVGSMRFWYEGLLRAQGLQACWERKEDCDCDCCNLFGNTKHSRQFRLRVEGLSSVTVALPRQPDKQALWSSAFRMLVHPRPGWAEYVESRIVDLLHTMSRLGGIGAKTQFGFGQFTIDDPPPPLPAARIGIPPSGDFFTLHPDRFFSITYSGELRDAEGRPYIQEATQIRAHGIRPYIEKNLKLSSVEANKLFGRVPRFSNDGEAYGGRIHASHYFRDGTGYSIKLWGDSVHRNGIVASIDEYISGIHPDWERKENTL